MSCAIKRRLARRWRLSAAAASASTPRCFKPVGRGHQPDIGEFCREWGIDTSLQTAGGLSAEGPQLSKSPRQIVMLQRKASKPGEGLGKTTGWIHRATLLARGVKMIPAVSYEKIDDEGLHVTIGGERQLLAVDQVVICAGQSRAASWRIRCARRGKRCISSAVATWRRSWMRVGRLPGH